MVTIDNTSKCKGCYLSYIAMYSERLKALSLFSILATVKDIDFNNMKMRLKKMNFKFEEATKKYVSTIEELDNKYKYLKNAESISSSDRDVRRTLIEIKSKLEEAQSDFNKIAVSVEDLDIQKSIYMMFHEFRRKCYGCITWINVALCTFDLTSTKNISFLIQMSELGNVLLFSHGWTVIFEKFVDIDKEK